MEDSEEGWLWLGVRYSSGRVVLVAVEEQIKSMDNGQPDFDLL